MAAMLALALPAGLSAVPGHAWADDTQRDAREAVERGEILPLDRVLAIVTAAYPGQVLDVQLRGSRRGGDWRYRIKMLSDSGRVSVIAVDAATGRILGRRGGN